MYDFEQIYADYFNEVFQFLCRLSGNPHIAEEITQQTFTAAYKSIDKFRGTCKLSVWLCQIAKHEYFSYYKKQSKMVSMDENADTFLSLKEEGLEEKLIRSYSSILIHHILHELPEPYKEIFTLKVFGELSYKEMAAIFKKSESWVGVTYYRAKQMIRKKLEEDGSDEV